MEFLIIVCSATLQNEINMLFERLEINGFTQLPQAAGAGEGGGIRLNDEIWPGENLVFMVAVSPEQAKLLKSWVKRYRQEPLREGLKLFSLPLVEMI